MTDKWTTHPSEQHGRLLKEHHIYRKAFRQQWLNILSLMKHFFFSAMDAHSHGKTKPLHPDAKEASSWAIIHLWIWFGVISALQCPSGLSSASLSLPTHYMQVLDHTWVPCDVQMVDFPLSRQFCHFHMKFRSGPWNSWRWALSSSSVWSALHRSPPNGFMKGGIFTWFSVLPLRLQSDQSSIHNKSCPLHYLHVPQPCFVWRPSF